MFCYIVLLRSVGAYNAWLDTMFKDTLITNSNLLQDVPTTKKNR